MNKKAKLQVIVTRTAQPCGRFNYGPFKSVTDALEYMAVLRESGMSGDLDFEFVHPVQGRGQS